jgi:hypothetical protein
LCGRAQCPHGRWTAAVGSLGAETPRPPQRDYYEPRAGRQKGAVPQELSRLQALLKQGLADTAALWPDVRAGYHWVYGTAPILSNPDQRAALTVQRRLGGLLGAMTRHQSAAGTLEPALVHFRKVTRSYWPGLFACYTMPELPRTNNDLEQFFGAYRYHERRATGRKRLLLVWS